MTKSYAGTIRMCHHLYFNVKGLPKISTYITIKSILLFYEESKETREGKNNREVEVV